ncbi:hypothetical protein KKH14_00240 [Patescibacteria group bacterium]|nr:hypothetical protein [Patescibacteria group bacterium]
MKHIKGFRDIKTHGTLAGEGRLVSVARDWHRIKRSGFSENESWDGSVERMVFKKSAKTRRLSRDLFQTFALEKMIRETQIKKIWESITEMEIFANEEISGAIAELQRLKTKLSQWESI